jgi:hypothetical protein
MTDSVSTNTKENPNMNNDSAPAEETTATKPAPVPPPEHIMQFFAYAHLPPHLAAVSEPFARIAGMIVGDEGSMPAGTPIQFPLPRNPERTVALRKLLEAKDAAVRAALAK